MFLWFFDEEHNMLRQKLEERWLRWWKAVGATGDGRAVFETVAAYYTEPHRAYHTLEHLEHCFEEFDRAKHLAYHVLTLELAIWLHDVVYDPMARNNEEKSAELALRLCRRAGLGDNFGRLVANLIRLTKHTGVPASGKNACLLLDIDLAILGQPPERFWEYERQIRVEYAWVPETEFREGRAKILQGFLRQRHLYQTWFFQERYEAQARANLVASIRALQGG